MAAGVGVFASRHLQDKHVEKLEILVANSANTILHRAFDAIPIRILTTIALNVRVQSR